MRRAVAIGLTGAGLVAAGCGGDGGKSANGRTIRAPQGKLPPLLGPVVAFARTDQGRAPGAGG